MTPRRALALLTGAVAVLAGCHKAEVTTYRIPKEKDPELPVASASALNAPDTAPAASTNSGGAAAGPMAATAVPTAAGGGLTWTAPAHWEARPASAMRKATYAIPGVGAEAELSITAFPGSVGGELANLNRWRGQVQLPPINQGELAAAVTRTEHDGLQFGLVDLVGPGATPQHLLGAWVPVGGATWFFKLLGPDAVVGKEKAAFLDFLRTVKPAAEAAP